MKIRTGFVSNSSSSSFCIHGVHFEQEEISGISLDDDEEGTKTEKFWDKFEKKATKVGLEVLRSFETGDVFLGRSYTSIEDDETGKQFRTSTKEKLKKLLEKEVECEDFEETISN